MSAEETCRLAAELSEEFGELVNRVAERAIATFEADGLVERAAVWRVLQAIIADGRPATEGPLGDAFGTACSPYLTVTEALQDPQVAHRGSLCEIEDGAGRYKSPAPPFRFSGSPLQSGPKVAKLGEHTESVLKEAGLASGHIEDLIK